MTLHNYLRIKTAAKHRKKHRYAYDQPLNTAPRNILPDPPSEIPIDPEDMEATPNQYWTQDALPTQDAMPPRAAMTSFLPWKDKPGVPWKDGDAFSPPSWSDWERAEYIRSIANKEHNLGKLGLVGGVGGATTAAVLFGNYYNRAKTQAYLKNILGKIIKNRGRLDMFSRNIANALPAVGIAASGLIGGLGTRYLYDKFNEGRKYYPKPMSAEEMAAAAEDERRTGGFDGRQIGQWYIPPVENSAGKLRPPYPIDMDIPQPTVQREGEYWHPQVRH